jgi:hypothetical protein
VQFRELKAFYLSGRVWGKIADTIENRGVQDTVYV